MTHRLALGLLLLAGWFTPALAQIVPAETVPAETGAGAIEATLTPVRDAGEVFAIDVRYTLDGGLADDDRLTLIAPIHYYTVDIADQVTELAVTDADGAVPLTITDEAARPGGAPWHRRWRANRTVRFPVEVAYRAGVQPAGSRGGPPFGIRPSQGGVSGAGVSFLVLPETGAVSRTRVRWDLDGLPAGSLAASSFGDGDFDYDGSPTDLTRGWYMAGAAGRYPATGDIDGYSATWLGEPPWDAEETLAWTGRVYGELTRFFQVEPARYRVFLRILDTRPYGGGTELTNSFLFSRGPPQPGESPEPPRRTLVHELIHHFVGEIDEPQALQGWFAEGLTSHYTSQLQLRGGHFNEDAYLAEVNAAAEDYYTSPGRNFSVERIAEVGFDDPRVRAVPYRRGQLYFAALDARIRAHSGGTRDLDAVMREVFAAREAGRNIDHDDWRALVEREAGPGSAAGFDALVLEGTETLVPPPGMLGPCFVAEATSFAVEGRSIEGYRWVRAAERPEGPCIR